ncbi:unnamed protein product [Paramecium sonneborni]|uniref:Uncharacterized protein n=1 Tax=Paramecium sonneborni TaxID=65129 RepID=A0A8S1RF41_9CILI|nr:unnamed protein product [Paramecium sonneborni]
MSQDVEIIKKKTPSIGKRFTVRRQGSILSDSKSTFEDSRITLLLLEQYRLVEMARFCVIFGTLIIAILEYECSFSDQFVNEFETETLTLLFIIFLMTLSASTCFPLAIVQLYQLQFRTKFCQDIKREQWQSHLKLDCLTQIQFRVW